MRVQMWRGDGRASMASKILQKMSCNKIHAFVYSHGMIRHTRIRTKIQMTYREKLEARIASAGTHLCVGLDVRADAATEEMKRWIIRVIEETAPYAAAFKPNSAYFEALGWQGMRMLAQVLKHIPQEIPIVLDVKRGDIGETQAYYAKACFDELGVDAVTLNPYMGRDTLEPFLKYTGKGLYLLGVTSNPGAADIELQKVGDRHVYEIVADMTQGSDHTGLVVGLTNASGDVLANVPDVPLLIPGLGAQGGDLKALKDTTRKAPILVNVSRGILYAEGGLPFASAAKGWCDKINAALGKAFVSQPLPEYNAPSRDASAA